MSYTVHNSSTYSDGTRTGYPGFTPNLSKCPNCGAVFFLHNLWAKKENADFEELGVYKTIANPVLADYIKAVRKALAKNAEEENELRTVLWRAFNTRGGLNDEDTKLRQDNCEKLLSIKEQKLNELIQTANLDGVNDLRIEIAELKRNLGRFDECLQALNELPESYEWLKRQFETKCRVKDPRIFKIRYKDENSDGDDCITEEAGEERRDGDEENTDHDRTINYWTREIEQYGDQWDLYWRRRALAYYEKGDYQSALSDINHAIEMNGDEEESFSLRAKINRALGNGEQDGNEITP
jgi:tetratricopeptide (TPR) repeat protein